MDELLEKIKNAKVLADDEPLDFSYPDGFLSAAKSLDFLPDDQTRIQMLMGLLPMATYF
jgi:hypothetical protein